MASESFGKLFPQKVDFYELYTTIFCVLVEGDYASVAWSRKFVWSRELLHCRMCSVTLNALAESFLHEMGGRKLICMWCLEPHFEQSLLKFCHSHTIEIWPGCLGHISESSFRQSRKSPGFILNDIPALLTASSKSSKLNSFFNFLQASSTRWWNESALMKVCPASKYLNVTLSTAYRLLFTMAGMAEYKVQFLFCGPQIHPG